MSRSTRASSADTNSTATPLSTQELIKDLSVRRLRLSEGRQLQQSLYHLLDAVKNLQFYARRYASGRQTYAPSEVNRSNETLLRLGVTLQADSSEGPRPTIWASRRPLASLPGAQKAPESSDDEPPSTPEQRAHDDFARNLIEVARDWPRQWTTPETAAPETDGKVHSLHQVRDAQALGMPAQLEQLSHAQLAELLRACCSEARRRILWSDSSYERESELKPPRD